VQQLRRLGVTRNSIEFEAMGELPAQFDAVVVGANIADASQVPHDDGQLSSGTAPAAAGTEARDSSKPRSGFARQKIKIQRLTDLYENLLIDHEALRDDHDKLLRDFHELDDAFNEVTRLNAELSAELRQARHRHPAQHQPVSSAT
jgi:hypothetical protein